jgi:hypothetical protein
VPEKKDTLMIRANIEMTAASLQAIVENAKKVSGPNEKGVYRVDTADKVSEMISRFLLENDFESFVKNVDNYRR